MRRIILKGRQDIQKDPDPTERLTKPRLAITMNEYAGEVLCDPSHSELGLAWTEHLCQHLMEEQH